MDHAATMRRLYDLISAGDIDGFGEFVADDFVEHEETPGLEPTKEGVKQLFHMYSAAFPDLRMEAQDVLASGDKVAARVRATGTHQGEFMGAAPTGRHVTFTGMRLFRMAENKIAESWVNIDERGLQEQLGAVPG